MAERKAIPNKVRFEVFKRDKFTCQYCGRKAPDVVLNIDHIKPVAKGGTNEIMNLVTSCFECNNGKRDKCLSDDSSISMQMEQLSLIEERAQQLEMLYEWKMGLIDSCDDAADKASGIIFRLTGREVNEYGMSCLVKLARKFGCNTLLESVSDVFSQYAHNTERQWEYAFSKIGGTCFNKTHRTCAQCINSYVERYSRFCSITEERVVSSDAEGCSMYESRFRGSYD